MSVLREEAAAASLLQQMRHSLFLWFIRREVQSSVTSAVPFLTMSDPAPKTHSLTSAERKCLPSIKGNADEVLWEVGQRGVDRTF